MNTTGFRKKLSAFGDSFRSPGLGAGLVYFFVHFAVEVVCFFMMTELIAELTGNASLVFIFSILYDALAFVPQGLFGAIQDRLPRFPLGLLGYVLLMLGFLGHFALALNPYLCLVLLCIGNAMIHEDGAAVTVTADAEHIAPAAVFVSGGSFGVITGKLLAAKPGLFPWIALFSLVMLPLLIIGQRMHAKAFEARKANGKPVFESRLNCHNAYTPVPVLVTLATFVVLVRGYAGYCIPTGWISSTADTVIYFIALGIGKALGGFFCDSFGYRKTAFLSIVIALPFLLLGEKIGVFSLIGVLLFSMTMPVTLGCLVSALKTRLGIAFGFTTLGLFLGVAVMVVYQPSSFLAQALTLLIASALCIACIPLLFPKDADASPELKA